MNEWLALGRSWVEDAYRQDPGFNPDGQVEFRWVDANDLTQETSPESAGALALTDAEVGWLLFFLPYSKDGKIDPWINQALGLRARLAREANYTGKSEPQGEEDTDAWQVGLVWLVAVADDADWQAEMALQRHESGASEELSFDRVLIAGNDVAAALDKHGLPRLMLASRQLLRRKADQVERWLSADAQVAEKLKGFSGKFSTPIARKHARWLEEQAAAHEATTAAIVSEQRRFEGFRVENFRNLKSLEIFAPVKEAESIVLFGPNGTGKSSFIEALSLSVFHCCRRSDDYLEDKDETSSNGGRFISRYLAPLNEESVQPTYRWGNSSEQSFEVLAPDKAASYEGVILDQDESRDFTDMTADELAARVLRGYSELAQRLNDELDRRAESAKNEKQTFFRVHVLNSSITKTETAYKRLAEVVLEQLKPAPSGFREWVDRIAHLSDPDAAKARELASRWHQFQGMPANAAEALAKLHALGADTALSENFKELLDHYNRLAGETHALLDRWEERYAELKKADTDVLARMDTWGDFLARPKEPSQASAESEALRKELEALARERADVERRGGGDNRPAGIARKNTHLPGRTLDQGTSRYLSRLRKPDRRCSWH